MRGTDLTPLLAFVAFWKNKTVTVTEEQLKSFIALFKQEFGVELTPVEARFRAESLLYFLLFSFQDQIESLKNDDIIVEPDLSI